VLSVAPAQHTREVLRTFAPHARPGLPVVLCSKGIEQGTLKLMTEVLAEEIPQARAAVLSGPGFASDVARGLPAAVTLACEDAQLAAILSRAIAIPQFRLYASQDLTGAEIGGAVKNVLAIAAGITEGRGLGRSAHAALVTRGFAEMARLGQAMGASLETLSGLAGLGDLMLTCSSPQSRNMSAGIALGRGESLESIMAGRRAVTEGVATAPAVVALARRAGVDMPICEAVCAVLDGRLTVDGAIDALLARPLTSEGA
jgi:glycerol-3-phosphate dehydrogenase (NAD(P)+)